MRTATATTAATALTALMLMMVMMPVVGVAAAQEDAGGNTTPTEGNATADGNESAIVDVVGEDDELIVRSIEWDGRTVTVEAEARDTVSVAVTDGAAMQTIEEGTTGDIPYATVRVDEGETETIQLTVADTGERSITIAAAGDMIGHVEERSIVAQLYSSPASWEEVRAGAVGGLLAGAGVPVLMAVLTLIAMRRDYRRVI